MAFFFFYMYVIQTLPLCAYYGITTTDALMQQSLNESIYHFFLKSQNDLENNSRVQFHATRNPFKPELSLLCSPHCLLTAHAFQPPAFAQHQHRADHRGQGNGSGHTVTA